MRLRDKLGVILASTAFENKPQAKLKIWDKQDSGYLTQQQFDTR